MCHRSLSSGTGDIVTPNKRVLVVELPLDTVNLALEMVTKFSFISNTVFKASFFLDYAAARVYLAVVVFCV